MNATATFTWRVPQDALDFYAAAAAARVLGTPRTRARSAGGAYWLFVVERDKCFYDNVEDEIDAQTDAWLYWSETLREDLLHWLDARDVDLIEECMEIEVELSVPEDEREEHSRAYQRAALPWGRVR